MKFLNLIDLEKIKTIIFGLSKGLTLVNKKADDANRKYNRLQDSFMRYSVINQPCHGLSSQTVSISTTFGNVDAKDPSIKEFYFGVGSLLRYSRTVELDSQDPYEVVNYESAMRIAAHFINAQAGTMSGAFVSKTSTDPIETLTGSYIFQAMPGNASHVTFNDLDIHFETSRLFVKSIKLIDQDMTKPDSLATIEFVNSKTSVLSSLQPSHAFGKISFALDSYGKIVASPTSAYAVEELEAGIYLIKLMHFTTDTAPGKADSWISVIGNSEGVMKTIPGWAQGVSEVPMPVDPVLIVDASVRIGNEGTPENPGNAKQYQLRSAIPSTLNVGESNFNWSVAISNGYICLIIDTNGYIKIPGVPAVVSILEPIHDIRFFLTVSKWSYIANGMYPVKSWNSPSDPGIADTLRFVNADGECDITIEHNACGDNKLAIDTDLDDETSTHYLHKAETSNRGSRLKGFIKPNDKIHVFGSATGLQVDKRVTIIQDETLPIKILDFSKKIGIRRAPFPIVCSDVIKKRIEVKDAKLPITMSIVKPDNILATIQTTVATPVIGKNVIAHIDVDQITSELTDKNIRVIARDSRYFDFTQNFHTRDRINLELAGPLGSNITPSTAKLHIDGIVYPYQITDTTRVKLIGDPLPLPAVMPDWYSKTFEIIVDTVTYSGTATTKDGLKITATPGASVQIPVNDIIGKNIVIDGVSYAIIGANDAVPTPGPGTPVLIFINTSTPLPPPNPMPYLYENNPLRFVSLHGEDFADIEVEVV